MDTADPNEGGRRLLPGAPTVRSERYDSRRAGFPPAYSDAAGSSEVTASSEDTGSSGVTAFPEFT